MYVLRDGQKHPQNWF